jgi:FkbM family methyltransferase
MFVSYAQNFEDIMLWRALGGVENGFYIDIGAHDPVVDSVSQGFYQRGWRGVHVEPVAHWAQRLREGRPDEIVIEAALAAHEGVVRLHEVEGTGLSTARDGIAAAHAAAGFMTRVVEVGCTTLDRVLEPHAAREIHWLKIDVEGFESEVLAGWRGSVRPWIVVIESTLPGSTQASYAAWEPGLLARGYTFAWFDGLNRFYVSHSHADLMRAFEHGAGVFDDFSLSGTATSSFCAVVNARADAALHDADALTARLREREQALSASEARAVSLDRALDESRRRAQALQTHVDAMTRTLSWRITAPLRGLSAARRTAASPGTLVQGALVLAKRAGVYQRLAPWLRERYPEAWARAKRVMLSAPRPTLATASPQNVATRGLIAHDTDEAEGFDALAAKGSASVRDIEALIQRQLKHQRSA